MDFEHLSAPDLGAGTGPEEFPGMLSGAEALSAYGDGGQSPADKQPWYVTLAKELSAAGALAVEQHGGTSEVDKALARGSDDPFSPGRIVNQGEQGGRNG